MPFGWGWMRAAILSRAGRREPDMGPGPQPGAQMPKCHRLWALPTSKLTFFVKAIARASRLMGKPRLGRITKMGDRYLRKLLVVGACSALGARKGHNDALRRWASGMLERKTVKYKFKLTAVALANKLARIVYALATKGGH